MRPDREGLHTEAREHAGAELLQTMSAIASLLGFLITLATLSPWLGARQPRPAGASVQHVLSERSYAAVLLSSFPIFAILDVFLMISIAKMALSILRRCEVELDTDLSMWCLLVLVLLPVAVGTNLLFIIVLFGDRFTALPVVCVGSGVLMAMYFAFRWLQKTLY